MPKFKYYYLDDILTQPRYYHLTRVNFALSFFMNNQLRICLYFQVHQPLRLRRDINIFSELESLRSIYDETLNQEIIRKVEAKCYLPMNGLLERLSEKLGTKFKAAFSFSGVLLEQLDSKVLESFSELLRRNSFELLTETYFHSLSFLFSKDLFVQEVEAHRRMMLEKLGAEPVPVFRHTELIYADELSQWVKEQGMIGVLAEGAQERFGPKFPVSLHGLPVLLKNYVRSDDIAFRFSNKKWKHYPLTPKKYLKLLQEESQKGNSTFNLFMDYETFGEHQWDDTGIFDFFAEFVELFLAEGGEFILPSEQAIEIAKSKSQTLYSCPEYSSWADEDRDLSAWMGNDMQKQALELLYSSWPKVLNSGNELLISCWKRLMTSDHFYYMSTKGEGDGAIHNYFSPYDTPYEAFVYFTNAYQFLMSHLDS